MRFLVTMSIDTRPILRVIASRPRLIAAALLPLVVGIVVAGCSWTTSAQAPLSHDYYLPVVARSDARIVPGAPPPGMPGRERWTTVTSSRHGRAVAIEASGGVVWVGTTGGGVVRWNVADGSARVYTVADGLADSTVSAILFEGRGNIWFGTSGGLSRVTADGEWTTANVGSPDRNIIGGLSLAPDGSLWISTVGGVIHARLDGTTVQVLANYTKENGLPPDSVNAIAVDAQSAPWIATGAGVTTLGADGAWHAYTTADGLSNDGVWDLAADGQGGMWFATGNGASHRTADGHWSTVLAGTGATPVPEVGRPCCLVSAVAAGADGSVWFGLIGRLERLAADGRWASFPAPQDSITYSAIAVAPDGAAWAVWDRGTERVAPDASRRQYVPEGLLYDRVNALAPDGRGGMWFGTIGGASHRDAAGNWSHVSAAEGLPELAVSGLCVDPDGGVWLATFSQGAVHREAAGAVTRLTTADGLASDEVAAVFVDRDGSRWFGTRLGLSRLDRGGAWRTFTSRDGLINDWVYVVGQDAGGYLWIGTIGGLTRMRPDGSRVTSFRDQLPSPGVRALAFGPDGSTWIATDYGVARYTDATGLRTVIRSNKLSPLGLWVTTVTVDTLGEAWVGTSAGVFRLHGPDILRYTQADGLADDMVQSLAIGDDGAVWIGTDGGASRFAPPR
jgi:ligand-binding sensor domain-containing protein